MPTFPKFEEFLHFSKDISYKLPIFEDISEFSGGSLLILCRKGDLIHQCKL